MLLQHSTVYALEQADTGLLMQVDADLAGCEALQAVPRLVYGMLRCALMMRRPGQHPDERVVLNHLWGSLPPSEIRCALYPMLSSFSDLDTMVGIPLLACNSCGCETLQLRQLAHVCRCQSHLHEDLVSLQVATRAGCCQLLLSSGKFGGWCR